MGGRQNFQQLTVQRARSIGRMGVLRKMRGAGLLGAAPQKQLDDSLRVIAAEPFAIRTQRIRGLRMPGGCRIRHGAAAAADVAPGTGGAVFSMVHVDFLAPSAENIPIRTPASGQNIAEPETIGADEIMAGVALSIGIHDRSASARSPTS